MESKAYLQGLRDGIKEVVETQLAVLKLQEQGLLDMQKRLEEYIKQSEQNNGNE